MDDSEKEHTGKNSSKTGNSENDNFEKVTSAKRTLPTRNNLKRDESEKGAYGK